MNNLDKAIFQVGLIFICIFAVILLIIFQPIISAWVIGVGIFLAVFSFSIYVRWIFLEDADRQKKIDSLEQEQFKTLSEFDKRRKCEKKGMLYDETMP